MYLTYIHAAERVQPSLWHPGQQRVLGFLIVRLTARPGLDSRFRGNHDYCVGQLPTNTIHTRRSSEGALEQ